MSAPHRKNFDSLLCFVKLVIQVVPGCGKKNAPNPRKVRVLAESAGVGICQKKIKHSSKLVPEQLRSLGPVRAPPARLIANLGSRRRRGLD